MSAGKINQEEALAKLKKDVRSLLMASKMGLEPEALKREYMAMLGHPIPLKPLGFINVLDMVKEMPDVVTMQFRGDGRPCLKVVSDESTRHIEELVAKQRPSKAGMVKDAGFRHFSRRYCSSSPSVFLPRRTRAPPALSAQLRSQLHILLSHGPLRLSDLESHFLQCFGQPLRVHNYGFYSTAEMLQAAADLVQVQQSRLGSVLSLREHTTARQLLKSNGFPGRTGSSVKSAPESLDTRAQTEDESSGQVTVTQGPQSLSPAEAVGDKPEMMQEGDINIKPVLKLEEELREMILEHHRLTVAISPELKNKLLKVVSQASGELSLYDLPAEYKRLFGEDLPLQQSGFASVGELLSYMGDTFLLKPAAGHDSGQQWIVAVIPDSDNVQSGSQETEQQDVCDYSSCGKSPWNDELREDEEEDDGGEKDLETIHSHKTHRVVSVTSLVMDAYSSCPAVPLDAMRSERLKPPTRHSVREMLEVQVEDVESPGYFHLRFSGTTEAQAMEILKIEMRQCYKSPQVWRRYRLPQQFVRRGQVCCVCPEGLWFYRAVIHQVLSSSLVEVYCVDYGSTSVVQSADLRFLKCSYSALPAQAVPASLAGIKPTTGSWTAEATASFLKLCRDRTLVGALECYTGDVLQLYLCDTHTDDDIYMHTVLLSQGHATACSPAASAARCAQVTPVSLYLGDGMIDLPDIEVETTSSLKQADLLQESTASSSNGTGINVPSALQNNQSELSCFQTNSWASAMLSCSSTSSHAPPYVNEGETPPSTWDVDLQSLDPPPSRDDSSSDATPV